VTKDRSSARRVVVGVGVVAVVAAGAAWVLTRDTGSDRTARPTDAPSASAVPSAFHFDVGDRDVMPTGHGRVSDRDRRGTREAADRVESLVNELYTGAFLEPERWTSGSYDDVYGLFAGAAREEARRRVGVLTAGADAAERFDRIVPMKGRLRLRILLDRGGNPIVVASTVRFRARGVGAEPALIRSDGSFLFRRIDGTWRIVAFGVERADRERSAP
jgi:hypothetical protein